MITLSRFDKDGKQTVIKTFETITDFERYMSNTKDPEKPEKPDNGCWNCMNFDWKHEACSINWHHLDDCYYNPACDDRELTDYCDNWEEDPDADPECLEFGGNEP
jgi:hypothetical protein